MGAEPDNKVQKIQGTLLKIPFLPFGRVVVSLPLFSLIFCFVTSILFKFDEVNKTVCNVQNLIPSISAITGVSPQRYVWRICIGLHCTPRLVIGWVYYNYYMDRIQNISHKHRYLFKLMAKLTFWSYIVENCCLVGVTYIANTENYPVHEKIFVVFMMMCIVYELLTVIMFKWCHPDPMPPHIALSYKWKKILFILILVFTAGLLYFFVRHRWFCEPNAFSVFSFCEYGIAISNIGFHYTATWEFLGLNWFVAREAVPTPQVNNHHKHE